MRPSMYVGDVESGGLHHLAREIIDNSVDEIANDYGDICKVILWEDGSLSVEDNGRGIPVEIHPKLGVSSLEIVFTKMHAGGKFHNDNYKFSGGLHGLGASAVNALSKWLEVYVWKNGVEYYQKFRSYTDKSGAVHSGIPIAPCAPTGKKYPKEKHGTLIRFLPDPSVMTVTEFDFDNLANFLQQKAFLNKNATFSLEDKRHKDDDEAPSYVEYCYKDGIIDLMKFVNEGEKLIMDDIIHIETKEEKRELEIAIQYTDTDEERFFSYVNNIPTTDGDHCSGFKAAFTSVLNDLARKTKQLKDNEENLSGEDYRVGMNVVLTVKMQDLEFTSQIKQKVVNRDLNTYVQTATKAGLEEYFGRNKYNAKIADAIIARAKEVRLARLTYKKSREVNRKGAGAALLAKLAPCRGKKAELNEIFIVEGDSAGGTAKQCRDSNIQAVLPLRGKVINAEKSSEHKLLDNEEIRTMIAAFGTGYGRDFNIANLKYDKIVILADADQDGGHIRSLLITFFYKYMRPLLTEGHVYIGMPPLYRLANKSKVAYVYSDKELEDAIKEMGRVTEKQRYKGLGEMNKEQLWATTMNPATRSLTRVVIDDEMSAKKMINTFMGEDADVRKEYISRHADFNKVDTFERKED
ncbi:MAG: DNA topoisomerase IV subunit B [Clostridia bacterium]|nr:DNA topoisomerase IV subunit B [Clostridia bacterium]